MGFGLGLRLGLGLGSRCSAVFLLFRSGGWVGGEMEIKANLEAELGNKLKSLTRPIIKHGVPSQLFYFTQYFVNCITESCQCPFHVTLLIP